MRTFLSILLLISSSSVFSQPDSHPYVFGGVSFPNSPTEFNKYWEFGFFGGVGYLIRHSEKMELGGELFYSRNGFNGEKFLDDFGFGLDGWDHSGGSSNIFAAIGLVNLKLTDNLFISGGGGMYNLYQSKFTATYQNQGINAKVESVSESKIKGGLNAGVNISFGQFGIRGKLHNIFTDDESTRLIDFGLTYSFE